MVKTEKQRVNLDIDAEVMKAIDQIADELYMSRAKLINKIMRSFVEKYTERQVREEAIAKINKILGF